MQEGEERVTVISAIRAYSYEWFYNSWTFTETASAGKVFIIIDAEVQNVGSGTFYAYGGDFSLSDSAAFHYDSQFYLADDGFDSAYLYPEERTGGKILFEVPEGASGLEVIYNFAWSWEEPKLAIWQLQW